MVRKVVVLDILTQSVLLCHYHCPPMVSIFYEGWGCSHPNLILEGQIQKTLTTGLQEAISLVSADSIPEAATENYYHPNTLRCC